MASDFRTRVIEVVGKIPMGQVMTYAQVAQAAGNRRAARAVGAIMRANKKSFVDYAVDPDAVPCHRVVAKNGLGGFNGGINKKVKLLQKEGWSCQLPIIN